MELRPYQNQAMASVLNEWDDGIKKTLLVLPTGTGKTIVFSKIIEEKVMEGKRVLVLAHRSELLEQASDKLYKVSGLKTSLEKAESTSLDSWERVVVGSVQTLMREKRLNQFELDHFDVIIVDEAHHAISNSYLTVLNYFENAEVLGVTATPDRGDMKNLGIYFESLAFQYSLPQAIKEGYLTPIKALTIPLKLDLTNVGQSAGDFKVGDLGTALDPYLHQIADEMVQHCMNRKTVVFLPLISTSQKFTSILNEKGLKAAEVNGMSKDREQVLEDFENNHYNVLCNSMLLTEGWDSPEVDCIVVLRPTKVRSLYSQMVGRGTRLFPGKEDLLLLDFLWHTERHELVHPAHLIAENDEVAQAMTKISEENPNVEMDLEELEVQGAEDVIEQREEALAEKLKEMRKRKRSLVDPLQFEMSIQAEDLSSYVPSFGWELGPPTETQLKRLEKEGILPDAVDNAGKASLLIDRINKRKEAGLATPKQIRLLERYDFQHVGNWSFDSASNMISRIAASGWRGAPKGVNPKEYKPEI
ncbi:DEAD/DEAH box helicase [Erysipelothrix urinaevulpis]|uniref:DEAD/DEAH box helicase n=1 Tax=Erysipelothrix urinaevulpis TaxID=2683717 RepID=UPI00135B3FC2|nr:DEAD/DEAH box helicase [Erysipelothrix urinaevulpis]